MVKPKLLIMFVRKDLQLKVFCFFLNPVGLHFFKNEIPSLPISLWLSFFKKKKKQITFYHRQPCLG